ncbi:MAG: hypothetical protein IT584_01730 [Chlamydiae bacterium]|nr:hypothetical protein [Chlamydiota bacterium]
MKQTFRRRKILFRCIAFSLLIHLGAAALLERNPIWLYSPRQVNSPSDSAWLACMSKEERELILKMALAPSLANATAQKISEPKKEAPQMGLQANIPDPSHLASQLPLTTPANFNPTHLLVSNAETIAQFSLPSDEPLDLCSYIPKDLLLPLNEYPITPNLAPPATFHPEKEILIAQPTPQMLCSAEPMEITYSEPPARVSFLSMQSSSPPALHPKLFNHLPELPTLEELETSSYSDEFDTDLVFLPLENEPGYLFALTLIPKEDLQLPKMKQHYMFLIDRANSIQKERLAQTKAAVYKALDELGADDTFNIMAFDTKMEKFSAGQQAVSKSSIARAKEYLQKIELGSFFSPADLYKPLLMTVPYQVREDEVYTAIVLTDGDSLSKKNVQTALFDQWTAYNQGKVAFYLIGMNGDKNLSSLSALCALNRGELSLTSTKRGMRRKLLKLLKSIQTPIVKNISCQAFSRAPNAHVRIYPQNSRTQHLYAGQPYVIVGTADTMDDFILFIQGRIKDRWLNIKKKVSFLSAKKGDASLKTLWSLQKAYYVYGQYLTSKNPEFLAEAKALADPVLLPTVF